MAMPRIRQPLSLCSLEDLPFERGSSPLPRRAALVKPIQFEGRDAVAGPDVQEVWSG